MATKPDSPQLLVVGAPSPLVDAVVVVAPGSMPYDMHLCGSDCVARFLDGSPSSMCGSDPQVASLSQVDNASIRTAPHVECAAFDSRSHTNTRSPSSLLYGEKKYSRTDQ